MSEPKHLAQSSTKDKKLENLLEEQFDSLLLRDKDQEQARRSLLNLLLK